MKGKQETWLWLRACLWVVLALIISDRLVIGQMTLWDTLEEILICKIFTVMLWEPSESPALAAFLLSVLRVSKIHGSIKWAWIYIHYFLVPIQMLQLQRHWKASSVFVERKLCTTECAELRYCIIRKYLQLQLHWNGRWSMGSEL